MPLVAAVVTETIIVDLIAVHTEVLMVAPTATPMVTLTAGLMVVPMVVPTEILTVVREVRMVDRKTPHTPHMVDTDLMPQPLTVLQLQELTVQQALLTMLHNMHNITTALIPMPPGEATLSTMTFLKP